MAENGLCACGCGGKTKISAVSNRSKGWTKGKPLRYIFGHWSPNPEHVIRHGHIRDAKPTRTYRVWQNMKSRCTIPNLPSFHLYGGRGIAVCERWSSFQNFLADMGECPEGLTLDRIDVNGGYSVDNCRWASYTTQAQNRRISVINTSGTKGVWFSRRITKWVSQIHVNGSRVFLGTFYNKHDAVEARLTAEARYWNA